MLKRAIGQETPLAKKLKDDKIDIDVLVAARDPNPIYQAMMDAALGAARPDAIRLLHVKISKIAAATLPYHSSLDQLTDALRERSNLTLEPVPEETMYLFLTNFFDNESNWHQFLEIAEKWMNMGDPDAVMALIRTRRQEFSNNPQLAKFFASQSGRGKMKFVAPTQVALNYVSTPPASVSFRNPPRSSDTKWAGPSGRQKSQPSSRSPAPKFSPKVDMNASRAFVPPPAFSRTPPSSVPRPTSHGSVRPAYAPRNDARMHSAPKLKTKDTCWAGCIYKGTPHTRCESNDPICEKCHCHHQPRDPCIVRAPRSHSRHVRAEVQDDWAYINHVQLEFDSLHGIKPAYEDIASVMSPFYDGMKQGYRSVCNVPIKFVSISYSQVDAVAVAMKVHRGALIRVRRRRARAAAKARRAKAKEQSAQRADNWTSVNWSVYAQQDRENPRYFSRWLCEAVACDATPPVVLAGIQILTTRIFDKALELRAQFVIAAHQERVEHLEWQRRVGATSHPRRRMTRESRRRRGRNRRRHWSSRLESVEHRALGVHRLKHMMAASQSNLSEYSSTESWVPPSVLPTLPPHARGFRPQYLRCRSCCLLLLFVGYCMMHGRGLFASHPRCPSQLSTLGCYIPIVSDMHACFTRGSN